MNIALVLNFVGVVLMLASAFMLLPLLISFIYSDGALSAIAISCLLTFLSGVFLYVLTRSQKERELRHRDGFAVVTISWVVISLFGSLPFILSDSIPSFTDAYFEAMSGFTTTGASILIDIETIPEGILFWRSIAQWIGGMGIILFALAILPLLGTGGMQLFKAEVPEISVDKLRPRIIDTAKSLWFIYVGLTSVVTALYMVGGMDIFDAICHGFTTIATGGFSTKNASIAHFQSPFIEYTASVFMFLSGVSFALYFYLFRGNASKLLKSNEFRFYLTAIVIAIVIITTNLHMSYYDSFSDSLRYGVFQAVSIMTTTGYATADYAQWSSFAQIALLMIMFFGGMIGSTSGGMKQVRILIMLKQIYREIYQLIHPHAVTALKLNGKGIDKETLGGIWGFIFLFLFVYVIGVLVMSFLGLDIITSLSTVVSAMSNVGPALGDAGPADNYSTIPTAGKWVLILCMLIGRLEIYTVIVLFIPHFWSK